MNVEKSSEPERNKQHGVAHHAAAQCPLMAWTDATAETEPRERLFFGKLDLLTIRSAVSFPNQRGVKQRHADGEQVRGGERHQGREEHWTGSSYGNSHANHFR